MELPDTERLLSAPDDVVARVREALLASGYKERSMAMFARLGERLDDPMRGPIRVWHARRSAEPAGVIARVLFLHDPVEREDAERAFGDLAPLIDAGLLQEEGAGLVSPWHLALAGDLYVLGDRSFGGAAVPPLNAVTLALARAAAARRPIERALDLGCGAGAIAIALARASARVVATDLSLRALALTRYNARLNAVSGIDVRHGDLFDTVGTERFDRIASQPPFIARPDSVPTSSYAHGGHRGDELALRAIAGVASHLTPSGRAVLGADWPVFDKDPLDARVRAAVGDAALTALVLPSPPKNLDEYCALLAAAEHPELSDAFARGFRQLRDHFEDLGLRGMCFALTVLTPSKGRPHVSLVPVRHAHDAPITEEAIDRIAMAHTLAGSDAGVLQGAALRLPAGARLIDQPVDPGSPAAVIVQLPSNQPEWPIVLDAGDAAVLRRIEAAPTVRDAALALASEEHFALDRAVATVERVAREALRRGALAARSAG